MEVAEILDLDDYYRDDRFTAKKPDLRGTWQQRCGDNFYSRKSDGTWIQHRNRFHLDERLKEQDTRYARVFVGQRFWYRGRSADAAPAKFAPLAGGRGARVKHDARLVAEFRGWVSTSFPEGIADAPNDNPDMEA